MNLNLYDKIPNLLLSYTSKSDPKNKYRIWQQQKLVEKKEWKQQEEKEDCCYKKK